MIFRLIIEIKTEKVVRVKQTMNLYTLQSHNTVYRIDVLSSKLCLCHHASVIHVYAVKLSKTYFY